MDEEDKERIKGIGKALVTRRVSLDPERHRGRPGWMETVRSIASLSQTTISHVETGARDDYGANTLAALEELYKLHPGTLGPALKGTGQLISEDGELLYPTSEPLRLPDPDPVEEWARQLAQDVKKALSRLAPEEAEEAMGAARGQALLAVDAELYRRGYRKKQE